MKVFVSQSGWVEIHDPNNKETHLQGFYNLKDVKEGIGFIVVQLKSGKVEVYDYHLNLLAHQVFKDIKEIQANDNIEIISEKGEHRFYDKHLKTISA